MIYLRKILATIIQGVILLYIQEMSNLFLMVLKLYRVGLKELGTKYLKILKMPLH